ncbi:MAG: TfoX/Sxy family protein [Alphaproteobacteria bacterium]|nr:TfoX/Sxy family protein [Alphaproteobacteria bacterium]
MAVGRQFRSQLDELLAPIGRISIREMFGGAGIFHEDVMFALVADETLYLKVDDATRPDFEAEGSHAFAYETSSGRRQVMSYYEVPDRLFDEPDEFLAWARMAIASALRARRSRPPARSGAKGPLKRPAPRGRRA